MPAAIRAGLISRDEYHDLTGADLIIRGRNRCHAAVEISLGPGEDDMMDRAIRRAGILHRATAEQAVPVVATPDPLPALLQAAEEKGLAVLDVPA